MEIRICAECKKKYSRLIDVCPTCGVRIAEEGAAYRLPLHSELYEEYEQNMANSGENVASDVKKEKRKKNRLSSAVRKGYRTVKTTKKLMTAAGVLTSAIGFEEVVSENLDVSDMTD